MQAQARGYFSVHVPGVTEGARYRYLLDGERLRPDPVSRSQPEGVHGPSEVVDLAFTWTDEGFTPPPLREFVIYELHVGTFTPGGTFESAIAALPRLVDLGVTAVEVMPIAQFPGSRNWGYDGVCPFAVQNSYGGPRGFARFVDACHRLGLAVVLDVVYNHLGPEGNYLGDFAPYFTTKHTTPWGPALNFDGRGSDEVRRYFLDNALMWLDDFHVDALRLDAVHGIVDGSPVHFLEELSMRVDELERVTGKPRVLMAENDTNDPRMTRPRARGGLGIDAVWADDFHHCVHVILTGEDKSYYADFRDPNLLLRALRNGFAYDGQYSAFHERRRGAPAGDAPPSAFVVCVQNHDQVGNRMLGDRLSTLTTEAGQRLAAALLLTSAHVPLLFMGEEYGERRPFAYFVSHGDPELVEAVRKGRKEEFAAFAWGGEPPDPQSESTFVASRIDPTAAERAPHRGILDLYRTLIRLRKESLREILAVPPRAELRDDGQSLVVRLSEDVVLVANLGPDRDLDLDLELGPGSWRLSVDGEDALYGGRGRRIEDPIQSRARIAAPRFWFGIFFRTPA